MKKYILSIVLLIPFYFSIAHVALLYPEGNETFSPGETVNIQWEELVPHSTLNWDLFYSSNGGFTWEALQTNIPYETLNYNWTVPEINTVEAKIKIIQDNPGTDYEAISENFTISFGSSSVTNTTASLDQIMYPNPVTNTLFVKYDQLAEYRILSIIGKQIIVGRLSERINSVDVSDLSPGIYMLEINHKEKPLIRKFIKK